MDIKDAALYLLLLRIVSTVALAWVLWRQIGYLRQNNPPEEQKIRVALAVVTLVLMGGNLIPIFVDVLTLASSIERSSNRINSVGIAYTFSNATFSAVVGLSWAFFYWLADREKVYLKKENRDLHNEVDQLHQDAEDVADAQGVKDVKSAKDLSDAKAAPSNRKKA